MPKLSLGLSKRTEKCSYRKPAIALNGVQNAQVAAASRYHHSVRVFQVLPPGTAIVVVVGPVPTTTVLTPASNSDPRRLDGMSTQPSRSRPQVSVRLIFCSRPSHRPDTSKLCLPPKRPPGFGSAKLQPALLEGFHPPDVEGQGLE